MLISIKTRDEDGSRYMMCAGTVTREVKIGATAKGTPKAEFGMKYAKGEFMNVSAVGDDDVTRMASCLEREMPFWCAACGKPGATPPVTGNRRSGASFMRSSWLRRR